MAKYDKILSDLLTQFYIDNNIDENVRVIVEQVINVEMNKLEMDKAWGIREEISRIIEDIAKDLQKFNKS
jgi:hypothetical protein